MKKNYYAMIMAGGGGTRLWPLSRTARPKQMQKISGDRSMFQLTVDRLADVMPIENVFVLTTAAQSIELMAQMPEIPRKNFLLEPAARGTASVIGLGAIHLLARDPNATMVVLPSDHLIQNVELFCEILGEAYDAAQAGHLVTIGIEPTFPSTGMGYIEEGERIDSLRSARTVVRFREKPDLETAKTFIASGKFWWNGGMFIWRADRIMEEIAKHLPDLNARMNTIRATIGSDDYDSVLAQSWDGIVPTTIDYGVLEKADNIVFIPAKNLQWNDIGSWESLFDVLDADGNGNITLHCSHLAIDSHESLVGSDNPEKLIVTIGMNDTIVFESGNAILVCPRSEAQRVREAVDRLKAAKLEKYY